ncbi:hypothetical protein Hanom_Chr01g00009371 [Helianthus anomalus]
MLLIIFLNKLLLWICIISRVVHEPNRADLCSCLACLQTKSSETAHSKQSHKSSEHFSSRNIPNKVRAIPTTVSPDLNLMRDIVIMFGLKFFVSLKT